MIKRLLLFSVLALGALNLNAEILTKVTVEQAYASNDYTMYSTGKMYFSGSQLVIDTIGDGNLIKTNISAINKLLFTTFEYDPAGDVRIINGATALEVYPNPASDVLAIQSSEEGQFNYQILSVTGRILKQGQTSNGASINVSSLEKGVYFIRVNGSILKFSKL